VSKEQREPASHSPRRRRPSCLTRTYKRRRSCHWLNSRQWMKSQEPRATTLCYECCNWYQYRAGIAGSLDRWIVRLASLPQRPEPLLDVSLAFPDQLGCGAWPLSPLCKSQDPGDPGCMQSARCESRGCCAVRSRSLVVGGSARPAWRPVRSGF